MTDDTTIPEPAPEPAPDANLMTADDTAPSPDDYAKLESAIQTVIDADNGTTTDDDGDGTAEADTDDDAGDIAKARRQAANYRTKLRDTEAERDQLREQVTTGQRAIIDWRAANHPGGPVDPALLDAAGIDVTDLLDGAGHLDMVAVDDFIAATAQRFSVKRAFTPNRAQTTSSVGPDVARPSLRDAFRPR